MQSPDVILYLLITIFSNIFFYSLGRYNGKEREIVETLRKNIIKKKDAVPTGVVDYVTPDKEKYFGSEEEKIDQQAADLIAKMWGKK